MKRILLFIIYLFAITHILAQNSSVFQIIKPDPNQIVELGTTFTYSYKLVDNSSATLGSLVDVYLSYNSTGGSRAESQINTITISDWSDTNSTITENATLTDTKFIGNSVQIIFKDISGNTLAKSNYFIIIGKSEPKLKITTNFSDTKFSIKENINIDWVYKNIDTTNIQWVFKKVDTTTNPNIQNLDPTTITYYDTSGTGTLTWLIPDTLKNTQNYWIIAQSALNPDLVYDRVEVEIEGRTLSNVTVVDITSTQYWGDTVSVNWQSKFIDSLKVSLYKDETSEPIITPTINNIIQSQSNQDAIIQLNHSFDDLPDNASYYFVLEDPISGLKDTSNTFTIKKPIIVTSPAASDTWYIGKPLGYDITWQVKPNNSNASASSLNDKVKMELYKDSKLWSMIEDSLTNINNSYNWVVDNTLSAGNNYKIKITNLADSTIFDFSDEFTIAERKIHDISSDTLILGQDNTITWQAEGVDTFNIYIGSVRFLQDSSIEKDLLGTYNFILDPSSENITEGDSTLKITSQDNSIFDSKNIKIIKPFVKISGVPNSVYGKVSYKSKIKATPNLGDVEISIVYNTNKFIDTLQNFSAQESSFTWTAPPISKDSINAILVTTALKNSQTKPDTVSIKIKKIPVPEIDPALNVVNLLTSTTPRLKWSVSDPNIKNYQVQISEDKTFPNQNLIVNDTSNEQNYKVKDNEKLERGKDYYWRVASKVYWRIASKVDSAIGDYSEAIKFTTLSNDLISLVITDASILDNKNYIKLDSTNELSITFDTGNLTIDPTSLTFAIKYLKGGDNWEYKFGDSTSTIKFNYESLKPEGMLFQAAVVRDTISKEDVILVDSIYSVQVTSDYSNDTITVDKSIPTPDSSKTKWLFFGSSIEGLSISKMFEDSLGTVRENNWRLFGWKDTANEYVPNKLIEKYKGYFFAQSEKDRFILHIHNSKYTSRSLFDTTLTISDKLDTLWHTFANPFIFPVKFSAASGVWKYNQGANNFEILNNGEELQPFEGYFVKGANEITLYPDSTTYNKSQGNNIFPEWQLELNITAKNKNITRAVTLIDPVLKKGNGVNSNYKNIEYPPAINNDFVAKLSLPNDEKSIYKSAYFSKEGGSWKLVFESKSQDRVVKLKKSLIGNIPDDYKATIINIRNGEVINEDKTSIYLKKGERKEYKVLLGTTDYIKEKLEQFNKNIPKEFSLAQNYPNPFNPSTIIKYSIPEYSHVTLSVYNILGQKIKDIVDGYNKPGNYSVSWNGTDSYGEKVASGIYFYLINTEKFHNSRKMILLK